MKKLYGIALLCLSLAVFTTAQAASIEQVIEAIRSGNAGALSKHFDSRIDISLPGKSENYSRNQAEMVLRDFFSGHPVRQFQIKHKGENNGARFYIGVLQTGSGNFRAKIYLREKGGQQVVQEISFQAE